MKARSTMLVMVVFAIAGISPAAAQTVYVERYETYPAAVAPGLAYVAPEPLVAPAPTVRRERRPTSYGLSEDASFAGTSHPEQTLGPRSGSARTAGPRFLSRWAERQLKEEQFSQELVSRPIPGRAECGGDQTNSAFLSEPWLVWAAASHAVMQRQTLLN